MRSVFFGLIGVWALAAGAARAGEAQEFMAPYRTQCAGDAIYASCVDQRSVLRDGLRQAKAQGKRAVVIFGFNSCPPCNALDAWLKLPEGQALMKSYLQIDLSIFDPNDDVRADVFDGILPTLKLHINRVSPYGVPLFAIIDPATGAVVGQPILGYDGDDPSERVSYLTAYRLP